MNDFERSVAGFIGEENLKKIRSVKIGIAGAGGLGSNCAAILVRCGFRNLLIADFDVIEHSNLNRQFYFIDQVGRYKAESLAENLKRINPDIKAEWVVKKLEKDDMREVYRDCEIVVEAFDAPGYKAKLVSVFMGTDKFIVSASGIAGVGRLDSIKATRINRQLVVVGDLSSGTDSSFPFSPRVSLAAARQADEVLAYVLGARYTT